MRGERREEKDFLFTINYKHTKLNSSSSVVQFRVQTLETELNDIEEGKKGSRGKGSEMK